MSIFKHMSMSPRVARQVVNHLISTRVPNPYFQLSIFCNYILLNVTDEKRLLICHEFHVHVNVHAIHLSGFSESGVDILSLK